jgi:hypothetical protein
MGAKAYHLVIWSSGDLVIYRGIGALVQSLSLEP